MCFFKIVEGRGTRVNEERAIISSCDSYILKVLVCVCVQQCICVQFWFMSC